MSTSSAGATSSTTSSTSAMAAVVAASAAAHAAAPASAAAAASAAALAAAPPSAAQQTASTTTSIAVVAASTLNNASAHKRASNSMNVVLQKLNENIQNLVNALSMAKKYDVDTRSLVEEIDRVQPSILAMTTSIWNSIHSSPSYQEEMKAKKLQEQMHKKEILQKQQFFKQLLEIERKFLADKTLEFLQNYNPGAFAIADLVQLRKDCETLAKENFTGGRLPEYVKCVLKQAESNAIPLQFYIKATIYTESQSIVTSVFSNRFSSKSTIRDLIDYLSNNYLRNKSYFLLFYLISKKVPENILLFDVMTFIMNRQNDSCSEKMLVLTAANPMYFERPFAVDFQEAMNRLKETFKLKTIELD